MTTRKAARYINNFGSQSVSQSVFNTITLESLDLGSSFLVILYILTGYGSSSYMKVIGSRSRSQEQKKVENSYSRYILLALCKTSFGNDSGSITHRTVKFAGSMGFLAMAD